MKNKKHFMYLLVTCCIIFTSSFLTVLATTSTEEIKAILNYGITIKYNGVAQSFTDAVGTRVYPISYNGTTYLPVRAVANLFEIPVDWDGANNTVILGDDGSRVDMTKLDSKATKYSWIIRDSQELVISGSDANQVYNSGLIFDIWNNTASVAKERVMYFPTNGKNTIDFTAWTNAGEATVYVYNENFEVIDSFNIKAGEFKNKTLNIAGCSKIAFGANSAKLINSDTNPILKIMDPTLYTK